MKVLKLILGLVLFLALSTNVTFAQTSSVKPTPEQIEKRAQQKTDNLAKKVELTEDQVVKVKEIYIKYRNMEVDARQIEDAQKRKEKLVESQKGQEKALRGVMTKEQLAKYDEAKSKRTEEKVAKRKQMEAAKRAEERGQEIPRSPSKGQPLSTEQKAQRQTDKMVVELSLSREQTTKVQAVNVEYYTKLDELIKSESDRTKIKELRDGLRTARLASLKEVLTEQQYKSMTDEKK